MSGAHHARKVQGDGIGRFAEAVEDGFGIAAGVDDAEHARMLQQPIGNVVVGEWGGNVLDGHAAEPVVQILLRRNDFGDVVDG